MIDGVFIYEDKNPLLLFPTNGTDVSDVKRKIASCNIRSRDFDWQSPVEISSSQVLHTRQYGRLLLFVLFGSEISPLLAEELLHKIITVLESYFKKPLSPALILENKAPMVLILSEMIDTGIPRLTEPSQIEHLLYKEGILSQLLTQATTAAPAQTALAKPARPPQQVPDSLIPWEKPWRPPRVKHVKEELFVDVIEHVRGVRKASAYGRAAKLQISGEIRLTSRLSADPWVTMDMELPTKLTQIQVHPAVDLDMLERSGSSNRYTVSFSPPDGKSCVARYAVTSRESGPLSVNLVRKSDLFEVVLSTSIDVKVDHIDNLVIFIAFPPGVKSVKELSSTGGDLDVSDPRRCVYYLGPTVPMGWKAQLKAQGLDGAGRIIPPLYVELKYSLVGRVPSSASVRSINISPRSLKGPPPPFKGVRYQTRVDSFITA